ncbi:hypothetical protein Tco_0111656 [Tanacetum coccineum]
MRSDELYKFSDRTLTGLRTSLDDITKNIRMEYLPKRRWSTLEKKRANIMIKAIDKRLKERRMMRSLEKFVGGRDYGTDLRLLQRTSSYCVRHLKKSQDHKKAKDHKMMIREYAWLMISKKFKIYIQVKPSRTSSSLKSMITTSIHKLKIEVKEYELKTKVKA